MSRFDGYRTRCAADEETGLGALGKTEHVEGAHEGRLNRLHSVELVVRWGRGAGKMVDFLSAKKKKSRRINGMAGPLTVTFNHERLNNIVADHLEVGVADPVTDSGF
jgi:hypothetical protein